MTPRKKENVKKKENLKKKNNICLKLIRDDISLKNPEIGTPTTTWLEKSPKKMPQRDITYENIQKFIRYF